MITKEELEQKGMAVVTFDNLKVSAWGRANGQFVSYGLSETADAVMLVDKKVLNNSSN